jgi:hypothetical protein
MRFLGLTNYKNGISPKTGEVFEVTDKDAKRLLKLKNGQQDAWQIVRDRKVEEA